MIRTGLVSLTFRSLEPREVIRLVAEAGLEGIEWGGNFHCPLDFPNRARDLRTMTVDAGLQVASYGSVFRPGEDDPRDFAAEMDIAVALQAPTIRVWAGKFGSAQASGEYRQRVVNDTRRIAEIAASEGIVVAYEYHHSTLTDTTDSAVATIDEVGHEAFRLYWQPPMATYETRLAGLSAILPKLANVHVHWVDEEKGRMPLAAGKDEWSRYLSVVAETGRDHWALLEFVKGDTPESFFSDAVTLKTLVGNGA